MKLDDQTVSAPMDQLAAFSHLPTPVAVIDRVRLERNIRRMADRMRSSGIGLRPHVKTHKSPDIAALQMEAGAVGLTVATLGEAQVFARAGFRDLFIAYPIWLDTPHRKMLDDLLERDVRVTVGIESAEAAALFRDFAENVSASIEVDSGHHRSGVAPDKVGAIADAVLDLGLNLVGAFTFPGHSYTPEGRGWASAQEATALKEAGEALNLRGISHPVLSGGATPSVEFADNGVVNEVRPGVYALGDAQQWELGSAAPNEIAYSVHGTVVSRRAGRIVVDAGSKVLAADRMAWATGAGRLLDHPEARITQLSEHHAVVDLPTGSPLPSLGDRLRMVPNHVCNAVNLIDTMQVLAADGTTTEWKVAARGMNN